MQKQQTQRKARDEHDEEMQQYQAIEPEIQEQNISFNFQLSSVEYPVAIANSLASSVPVCLRTRSG